MLLREREHEHEHGGKEREGKARWDGFGMVC